MDAKKVFDSKTVNINTILLGFIGGLAAFGIELPTGLYEALLAGIPLANIILRFFTKKPITLTGAPARNQGSVRLAVLPILAVCGLVLACVTISNTELRQKHCSGGPSIILDNIPNAKQVDLVLQVSDYAVLQNNPQLVPKVKGFFKTARSHLRNDQLTITGQDVVVYMADKIKLLKDTGGRHLFFISQLAGKIDVPDPVTACDRKLLLLHMDNIERKVFPFVSQ